MKEKKDSTQKLLELGGTSNSEEPDTKLARGISKAEDALRQPDGGEGESVITQVTHRESTAPPTSQPREKRWGLRRFLCCFRPAQNEEYWRQSENEKAAAAPPRNPRTPPLAAAATAPAYTGDWVMPPIRECDRGKKTLVLDLDETLVHSSFKPISNADYIIPVEIDGKVTDVYVLKRPWVDHFMAAVSERFEVVIFTASLAKYADPLLDLLDRNRVSSCRLFRDSCCPYEGNYVKDLSRLGRPLKKTIIVDNSPHSYIFQPENAVPIGTFIDDPDDRELLDLVPYLAALDATDDVIEGLAAGRLKEETAARRGRL